MMSTRIVRMRASAARTSSRNLPSTTKATNIGRIAATAQRIRKVTYGGSRSVCAVLHRREISEGRHMGHDPLDTTFAALADPTRRAVIRALLQKRHRAGELAAMVRMSPPALSRHLRVLRKAG